MKNCASATRFKTAARLRSAFRAGASRHRNVSSFAILFLTRDRERARRPPAIGRASRPRYIPVEYNPLNAAIYSSIRWFAYLVSLVKPLIHTCRYACGSACGKVKHSRVAKLPVPRERRLDAGVILIAISPVIDETRLSARRITVIQINNIHACASSLIC